MSQSLPCALAVAAMFACDDFDKDLNQYCFAHPDLCGDSGSGGGSGGGGGGTGACHVFGDKCGSATDCCATTNVSGTDYPMACSRVHYCQLASPFCLAGKSFCSSSDQCCTGFCDSTSHQCSDCAMDGDSCTTGKGCCEYELCGDDGVCHFNNVGDTLAGGKCASSAVCSNGYCQLDAGICFSPTTASCTPLAGASTANCCPGLESQSNMCCEPLGTRCNGDTDCCSAQCWGGFCQTAQPGLGGSCDNSNNCTGSTNLCDPVENICVDRWCYGSTRTKFKGCCVFSSGAFSCNFDDGGVCIMPGAGFGADVTTCCAGHSTDGTTCDGPYLYDP